MVTTSILKHWPAASELLNAPALPDLGPGPRPGVEPLDSLKAKLSAFFKTNPRPAESQELIRGAIYLWHDHMDASHTISQAIETPDGSLLHGILHRREPDYWNSKYWLRRVGPHPCYTSIAERVTTLLEAFGDAKLRDKLVPRGQWDALAFVDQCEKAAGNATAGEQRERLKQVQQAEFDALLEYFLGQPGAR